MATSINTHYKNQLKATEGQMNADISAVEDALNKNLAIVDENYAADVANTEQAYNSLYDQNAVSKIINERKIAENMANLGLTDSGLNRTQQTANQLSYANTNNQIGIQKQKAIDTLAQTMRNKKTELETTANTNIAGIKSSYSNAAMNNATSQYNAEVKADADMYKANLDASVKAAENAQKAKENMYNEYYKNGGVYEFVTETEKGTDDFGNTVDTGEYANPVESRANRFFAFLDTYGNAMTSQEKVDFINRLAPDVKDIVIDRLNSQGEYIYNETDAVKSFNEEVEKIKAKYPYPITSAYLKKQVEALIKKTPSLTKNDIATILSIYGMTNQEG
jgi:hypothetical protein